MYVNSNRTMRNPAAASLSAKNTMNSLCIPAPTPCASTIVIGTVAGPSTRE